MQMKIAVAAEAVSFPYIAMIKEHLTEKGHQVLDLGMSDKDKPLFFYEIAPRVARAIQEGEAERGILMCGTGMGVCICANKFKGIYACLAESATTAGLHYVINRANVLCLGKWIVGEKVALDIIDRWLCAEIGAGFSEERRRVQAAGYQKIVDIEKENFKGSRGAV
jgi:ribose 5-phosphate isomerase B